jgi:anaerobic selenocysteine-containing dehydrogenase
MLDGLLAPAGMNYQEFIQRGYLCGKARFRKYEDSGFKTPTGKVELYLSKAETLGLPPLPGFNEPPEPEQNEFPLVLTSCKDRFYLHSSYRWVGELRRRRPRPLATVHPQTAADFGIADGEEMIIETPSGRIIQTASLSDAVMPGVVFAAYGWWFPEMPETDPRRWQAANFNCLTTVEGAGKQFGTPNLKGISCRIRKA